MKTPERSPAIGRALAAESDGLPEDFAARVAAQAEAGARARHWSWNDAALLGAFIAMLGVCVAGWFSFAPQEPGDTQWLAPLIDGLSSRPWLLIGTAAVGAVQMLTFSRRAHLIADLRRLPPATGLSRDSAS